MGDDAFDDLARTLTQPMSRRRAVRIIGGAVAAAALPAFKAAPAQAWNTSRFRWGTFRPSGGCDKVCTPPTTVCGFEVPQAVPAPGSYPGCNIGCCHSPGDVKTAVCCNHNHETGSWCCPKGYTCGSGKNSAKDPNCRCDGTVTPSGGCCPKGAKKCGGSPCCEPGETCCGVGSNERCCKADERCCQGDGPHTCCPRGRVCCTGSSLRPKCCAPGDVCAPKFTTSPHNGLAGAPCCPPGRLAKTAGAIGTQKVVCCWPPYHVSIGRSGSRRCVLGP